MESWIQSETVYNGRVIRVHKGTVRLDDGHEAPRELVEHPGSVAVVPILDDSVLLVRQYRVGAAKELLEIPAGTLEPGDTEPEHRAGKELEEETGYRAGRLVPAGRVFMSPGFLSESMYLFLAHDLTRTAQDLDVDERIDVVPMPIAEVRDRLYAGQFEDAKTVCGLYVFLNARSGSA